MISNRALLTLSVLAGAAAPALAHAAYGPAGIAGVWESPWPQDEVRPPGSPPRPVEVTVPPLKEPYLQQWKDRQKAVAAAIARGEPEVNNSVRCIPPGFPAMMAPGFPVEVLETPGQVTIINEAFSQVRRIYLGEKQLAVDDAEPYFFGHSVGHWEGDALVVDTVGVKTNVKMRDAPHSANMKVDERLYPTSKTTFEDKVTVTDPEYLTGPWTWTWHYVRKPDYKINEFICENNREYADPTTGKEKVNLAP